MAIMYAAVLGLTKGARRIRRIPVLGSKNLLIFSEFLRKQSATTQAMPS